MDVVQRRKLKCIEEMELVVCIKNEKSFEIPCELYIEKRGRLINGLE